MIDCPECGGRTRVKEVKHRLSPFTYRRRQCRECGHRFSTHETLLIKNPITDEWKREALARIEGLDTWNPF